jgi:hypothetical protein
MKLRVGLLATLGSFPPFSGPTAYTIGPDHTCPSFEVDHFIGLFTCRDNFF